MTALLALFLSNRQILKSYFCNRCLKMRKVNYARLQTIFNLECPHFKNIRFECLYCFEMILDCVTAVSVEYFTSACMRGVQTIDVQLGLFPGMLKISEGGKRRNAIQFKLEEHRFLCLQCWSEPFNGSFGFVKVRWLNYLVKLSWLHCLYNRDPGCL